jgi:hypothetical protein
LLDEERVPVKARSVLRQLGFKFKDPEVCEFCDESGFLKVKATLICENNGQVFVSVANTAKEARRGAFVEAMWALHPNPNPKWVFF